MNRDDVRVAVLLASLGRPKRLGDMIERLGAQTLPPMQIVISVERDQDVPGLSRYSMPVSVVQGPRGLCAQRNRGLREISDDADLIAFFDDDYVPSRRALEGMAAFFSSHPEVGGASGALLADGAKGPGIAFDAALGMIEEFDAGLADGPLPHPKIIGDMESLYGCNMVVRASAARGLYFDENLPLYGWQEDADFTARISGRAVSTDAFTGLHCGEKAGRETKGKRLGYSQIANPVYLMRKGTMTKRKGLRLMYGNVLANLGRALWSEPWIDRRGRVAGNWLAIWDLLLGRQHPSRILDLS